MNFYGNTAKTVQIMLHAKIGKAKDKQIDDLFEQIELSKTTLQVAREYWYLSKAYSYIDINEKSKDCLTKSQNTLEAIAAHISDKKYREDYLNKPLIHQLITGKIKNLSSKSPPLKKPPIIKEQAKDDSTSIFSFCPNCGFDNANKFKFCPQCGTSLET